MNRNNPKIQSLRNEIETTIRKKIKTPNDFKVLANLMTEKTKVYISSTTLKRVWGYVEGGKTLRLSTLDILSRFLDYYDFQAYLEHLRDNAGIESDFLQQDIIKSKGLPINTLLEVTWLPNRRCIFKHLGEEMFEVIESDNSKLQVGNRFNCSMFIKEEPLYIDNLKQDNKPTVNYIAGSKEGIRFIVL